LVLLLSLGVVPSELNPPLLLLWKWWSSPSGLELGTMEFLLVVKPLSYYSCSFYSTLLTWLCLLLH
jgi:hypothetical protein